MSVYVPSEETDQNDEIDRANEFDNFQRPILAIPAKIRIIPERQVTDHRRDRRNLQS